MMYQHGALVAEIDISPNPIHVRVTFWQEQQFRINMNVNKMQAKVAWIYSKQF